MIETLDVAIIGAGPAGMAAAEQLYRLGLRVIVLDERAGPGGNVNAAGLDGPFSASHRLGRDYARGARATRAFAASGVPARYGCSISRVDGEVISYLQDGSLRRLSAARLVVATGAIERTMPFPAWELPGVMGAGAFQLLMKQSGVVPACDYVLCGSGPLVLLMACQLLSLGSRPVAVLDTNATRSPFGTGLSHPATLAQNAGAVAKGLAYLSRMRLAGIPIVSEVVALEAAGTVAVERLHYTQRGGRSGTISAGLVLCHEGVIPNTQLTLALGCKQIWNPAQSCMVPETDEDGQSSRAGTFVVGDAAGILGATAAPHLGTVAAMRIAQDLGRIAPGEAQRISRTAKAVLARERAFRVFLDRLPARHCRRGPDRRRDHRLPVRGRHGRNAAPGRAGRRTGPGTGQGLHAVRHGAVPGTDLRLGGQPHHRRGDRSEPRRGRNLSRPLPAEALVAY